MKFLLYSALPVLLVLSVFSLKGEEMRENPRTSEVFKMMNLKHPGFEKVRKARTLREKQKALFEYFKKRKMPRLISVPRSLGSADRKMADDALQHKFPGQRAYPPQFRGKDRLDWDSNPMGDQEWIWQLHRFYWWESLGRAWLVTREEKYAREWVFELNSWVDHMHKEENFEKHPGWRPLETGSRLALFPKMAEYFQDAAAFDSHAMINLLWTMGKHIASVEKRMSGMNNHRMHEWDGQLTFLLQYPEYQGNAERTRAIYDDIVKSQRILMLPDGVINEFIPSYHNGNVAQFLAFRKRAERYGFPYHFPESYDRIIQNGVTAVMLWSHPDGACPQFGDAWHKSPGVGQSFVQKFLNEYHRPDWEYFVSRGKKGKAPDKTVHVLEPSGYATMRSSWNSDALFLVAKNSAPKQPFAHNHSDNLSFELSAFGQALMVDSGCYSYFGTPEWRGWFRQPFAHQLVTLENKPIRSRGRQLWHGEFPSLKVISMQNNPYDTLTHRRTFFLLDNQYILILDELSGKASGELRQHFQFMPGRAVFDSLSLVARTQNIKGANLLVKTLKSAQEMTLVQEEGWISREYMKKEPRPAFAFVQPKRAGQSVVFLTLIVPLPEKRQIWSAELSFEKAGRPVTELTDTIHLRLNNLEDYTLTFSHEKKRAALKKNFKPFKESDQHQAFYMLERPDISW